MDSCEAGTCVELSVKKKIAHLRLKRDCLTCFKNRLVLHFDKKNELRVLKSPHVEWLIQRGGGGRSVRRY